MTTDPSEPRVNLKRALPEAYRALAAMTRSAGLLGGGLDELVKVRASIINRCSYCIETHTSRAVGDGEDQRRLDALAAWRDSDAFTPRERAALAVTDALTSVEPAEIATALGEATVEFSDDELNRLVTAVIAINAWNRAAIASGLSTTPG